MLGEDTGSYVLDGANDPNHLAIRQLWRRHNPSPNLPAVGAHNRYFQLPGLAVHQGFLQGRAGDWPGLERVEAYPLFKRRSVSRIGAKNPGRLRGPVDRAGQHIELPTTHTRQSSCAVQEVFAFAERLLARLSRLFRPFPLFFYLPTSGVIGANQQIPDYGVLSVTQCGDRYDRWEPAAILSDVGQLINVFNAARGLEHQRVEARSNRGSELRAERSCARAITSCGSDMSAGVILFIPRRRPRTRSIRSAPTLKI